MTGFISLKTNATLRNAQNRLRRTGGNINLVLKNGTREAARRAKIKSSTEIRKDIAPRPGGETPKSYVDKRLSIRFFNNGHSAAVSAESRGILLTRFQHKQAPKGRGIYVKVKPSGGRKLMPGAFLINRLQNSGVPGIALNSDFGIDVLHGPSTSQVFAGELDTLEKIVAPIYVSSVLRETRAAIRGFGPYA